MVPSVQALGRSWQGASGVFAVVAACVATLVPGAATAATRASRPTLLEPVLPLTSTTWLFNAETPGRRWVLPTGSALPLLQRWRNPAVERAAAWTSFWSGPWGSRRWHATPSLAWTTGAATDALPSADPAPDSLFFGADEAPVLQPVPGAALSAAGIGSIDLLATWVLDPAPAPHAELLFASQAAACPTWQPRFAVTLGRYGAENDTFALLGCDGSVATDAIDRLSVIARPIETPRPELPLPLEPQASSTPLGEWVPGVKLVHPRLVWLLQQVADAFPGHPIYVISGYRRESPRSMHAQGRALDLFVNGVPNEELFLLCRKLHDVACGYYPFHNFVHVDVRPPGTGHPLWVDVSLPGEPSQYVDGWPGVVERGALAWKGEE